MGTATAMAEEDDEVYIDLSRWKWEISKVMFARRESQNQAPPAFPVPFYRILIAEQLEEENDDSGDVAKNMRWVGEGISSSSEEENNDDSQAKDGVADEL